MADWLSADRLPTLLSFAKTLFFSLFALTLLCLLFARAPGAPSTKHRIYRFCFSVIALLFVAVFVHQASWQLAGFARPAFVEFQKKYNRRPDSPAKKMHRGNIRDRNGAILATDDADDAQRRIYPGGAAFAHVVGYVNNFYGKTGIEAVEEPVLTGYSRKNDEEEQRFALNLLNHEDIRGSDVVLSLDARLQREAARAMQGKRGAVIVLDPVTGSILVLYSAPSFDPNRLTPQLFATKGTGTPLLNRALNGLYPPGSTFKMLIAAVGIEKGLRGPLDCPGSGYTPPAKWAKPIRDHEYYAYARRGSVWPGHGRIGMDRALAKSSNVYFAQLGVKIGPLHLLGIADKYQFDKSLSLYDGAAGRMATIPSPFPKLDSDDFGASAQIGIGQGSLLVTPMHMALVGSAIARDGIMMKPRLSEKVSPEALAVVMAPATAKLLRSHLRTVVTSGTGRSADVPGLDVCGKTGTAQTPAGDDHAWFVCMAPQARPKLVVAVLVEHGGFGAEAALPVAVNMLKKAQETGWIRGPATEAPR